MNVFYYGDDEMSEKDETKNESSEPDTITFGDTTISSGAGSDTLSFGAGDVNGIFEYPAYDWGEDGHSVVGNPYPTPPSPDTITFGTSSANTTNLGGSNDNDTLSLGRISEFGGDMDGPHTDDTIKLSDDTYPSLNSYLPPYGSPYGVSFDSDTLNFSTPPTPSLTKKPGVFKYNEDVALKDARAYVTSTYSGHYTTEGSQTQTLDLIQSVGDAESFCRSNAIKYLSRYDKKGVPKNDILKAIHYCLLLYYFDGHTTPPDSNYPY